MSDTRVSVLTPPGAGAIATIAVIGPLAWEWTRRLFRPAGKMPLPELPERNRIWFGRLGAGAGDEVVLAVKQVAPEPWVEIHCHGGRRVVRWVVEQFVERGCSESSWSVQSRSLAPRVTVSGAFRNDDSRSESPTLKTSSTDPRALEPLTRTRTTRTASILLDQFHGAFAQAVATILVYLDADRIEMAARELRELASRGPIGRHLVEPWRVVIAGPPNVGKSSLVNALAGYQRSVVSEVAGTTRDVVTVSVAFDGWPVELADTAGLRDASGLEAEGVERARRTLADADLILWVMDASTPDLVYPDPDTIAVVKVPTATGWVLVMNKADRTLGWPPNVPPGAIHLSAATGEGIPGLASWVAFRLVPDPPLPGVAVPFTPSLADLIEAAHAALTEGRTADAVGLLRAALPGD